jgi:hypothetical protein
MSEQGDALIQAFMDHQTALGSRYRRALTQWLRLEPDEMAAVLHLARAWRRPGM